MSPDPTVNIPIPVAARSLRALAKDPELRKPLQMVVPLMVAIGRVTLLVAREKLGKSTLARAMAAAVSAGRDFLGLPTIHGVVLWLALDEAMADIIQKLLERNAGQDEVFILQTELERRFDQLRREVKALRPRLLVIDTLASYVEAEDLDERSSNRWTTILNQLRRLAEEYQMGVLLLHHATKRDGSYRGTTAIGASVDQIIEMYADDEDEPEREIRCRGRWEIPNYRIRMDRHTLTYDYLGPVKENGGEPKHARAKRLMCEWLAANPGAGKTEITRNAKCKAEDARELFDELVQEGRIVPVGKGYAMADGFMPKTRAAESESMLALLA